MSDLPPHTDKGGDDSDDSGAGPGRGSTAGTPRWVKVFGIIAVALALLFVVLLLAGHGPGRHMP